MGAGDFHASNEQGLGVPFLTDLTGVHTEAIIWLPIGTTVIGRDAKHCEVILTSPYIDRFIARIDRSETETYIQDTNSRAGVWVNGERVSASGRRRLKPGDKVKLGPYVFAYSETETQNGEREGR